jgi:hypothetical protein
MNQTNAAKSVTMLADSVRLRQPKASSIRPELRYSSLESQRGSLPKRISYSVLTTAAVDIDSAVAAVVLAAKEEALRRGSDEAPPWLRIADMAAVAPG